MEQDCPDGITPAKFPRVPRKDVSQVKIFRLLALPLSVAMALSLAACQKTEAPAPEETQAASNGPDAKPGISGSDGHLVLPVVAGRPGAVYFTVRNDGPGKATLVGVHLAGAGQVQMHKTEGGAMAAIDKLDIAPGASAEFEPGGLHVMAFDLDKTLKAGGTTELTLTFAGGDKLSMPVRIDSMGGMGDHSGMPGMSN